MGINIGGVLTNLLEDEMKEKSGPVFIDYVPLVVLSQPTPTQYILSNNKDKTFNGEISVLKKEIDKIYKKQKLEFFTFKIDTENGPNFFKISYKELAEPDTGAPVLVKNRPYNIITVGEQDFDTSEEEEGGGGSDKKSNNFYNGKDIKEVNKELKDIKQKTETFKEIKNYKDDPDFQKIFLDAFISSTRGIKINKKPLIQTLKDLRANNLLEQKTKKDSSVSSLSTRERKFLKFVKMDLQNFMNNLFKLFAKLSKNGKQSKTYQIIQKFYKELFFIATKGKAEIADKNSRKKLWKKLMGSFSNLLSGLNKSQELVRGGGGPQSFKGGEKKKSKSGEEGTFAGSAPRTKPPQLAHYESEDFFILNEEDKKQIIFKDFKVSNDAIDDSMDDFGEESGVDNDGELETDEEGNPVTGTNLNLNDFKESAFYLYGKDAGRMFPRLSFKFKDIPRLFGLLGRGALDKNLDKRAEKLGVSRYELSKFHRDRGGDEDDKKGKKLPSYSLKFNNKYNIRDKKGKTYFNVEKDDEIYFEWDEKQKLFIHNQRSKKLQPSKRTYTNADIIKIEMKQKPKVGEEYKKLKIKLFPSGEDTSEIGFTINAQKMK